MTNLLLATDSYKLTHAGMYPPDTEAVYSYFESRNGAAYPYTVFFGLQYLLKEYLAGPVVTEDKIKEAADLAAIHFGNPNYFNVDGWRHILEEHGGHLPLKIEAVPEGTAVPTDNVLMTVQNTDPKVPWLTNYVESLLTHVWSSSNIATISYDTKRVLRGYLEKTADSLDSLGFMLHDFGYRGVSSHESAGIGGAGHLVNFLGTDTLPAMLTARDYYDASLEGLAYSVAATEHSVMTALGPDGEAEVVQSLLKNYPTGILSVVADSYDVYNFVRYIVGEQFRQQIVDRDGVFVVRPDSVTPTHPEPADQVVWILDTLYELIGGSVNTKGYRVLDPHVRVLWGDGIDPAGIFKILQAAEQHRYSAENLVFGMGGGLLQKHNRDTQRFAFKASAMKVGGEWRDVWKKPQDLSKMSKRGRLSLIELDGKLTTVSESNRQDNVLRTVFENGDLINPLTFDEVRANATHGVALA